jgi:hypothetical protein
MKSQEPKRYEKIIQQEKLIIMCHVNEKCREDGINKQT